MALKSPDKQNRATTQNNMYTTLSTMDNDHHSKKNQLFERHCRAAMSKMRHFHLCNMARDLISET